MIATVNRVALLLLGVVLALAGGYVLVAGAGGAAATDLLPSVQPGGLYERLEDAVAVDPLTWQAVLIAAGILVVVLGLRLVAAELRVRRPARRREVVVADAAKGRTTVRTASVSRVLARDLGRVRGVAEASVTARSLQHVARVDVVLTLARGIRLANVSEDIEIAYRRTRTALGAERLDVRCRVVFSEATADRVR